MTPLYLGPAGAVTALGLDLDRTVSSLRAGLDGFRRVPFMGASGEDLQAVPIVGFAEAVSGVDRYLALACRSIEPCLAGLRDDRLQRTAVVIGLPRPERPGVPVNLAERLREQLAKALGLQSAMVHSVSLGRVSMFGCLATARRLLAEAQADACVVGGVDVLTNGDSLRGLSRNRELKEKWDGYLPGEGAAFVHLSSRPLSSGSWGGECAFVSGIAAARELASGTKDDPLTGKAVAATLRDAMRDAALPETGVNLHINDLNGTRSAFEDNAFGLARYMRTPEHSYEVWHVASYLGETGAACGAIQLVWAQAALELGFAPGRGILLSAADGDIRSAAVLQHRGQTDRASLRRQTGIERMGVHTQRSAVLSDVRVDPGLALPTDRLHHDLIGRHLRELAWLWGVRNHHSTDVATSWTSIESYEQRLIAHVDALAWAVPDATPVLRAAWGGDDDLDLAAACSVLLSAPLSAEQREIILATVAKSPLHERVVASVLPHIPPELARPIVTGLVTAGSISASRAGLRAMMIAGSADPALANSALLSGDSSLVASAIQAAGALGMGDLLGTAVASTRRLAQSGNDPAQGGLTKVALLSLGATGTDLSELRFEQLARTSPTACALYCLREQRRYMDFVRDSDLSVAALDACGWAGEPELLPILLEYLASEDDRSVLAAAQSLHRISGLTPSPADAPEQAPDQPAPRMAVDRASWVAALRSSGLAASKSDRLRHGQPWHQGSALTHLERHECSVPERIIAAWEYAVVHGSALPLHPEQFVRAQRTALTALQGKGRG